ncbi:MAG: SET domain-containing protein [Bacteroidales bacterium]|nr:SET domain-containing protein [Bacteroidales bacterium]
MIHPDTELKLINREIGYGIFAKEIIREGTIVWVQDKLDRVITESEISNLGDIYIEYLDKYSFRNNKGEYILCWDNEKFKNHSFKNNCILTAYNFEIAIRDIYPGEELTDDYGYLNITEPFEPFGEGTERKIVYPDDLLNYYKDWDESIAKSFEKIIKVKQELRKFLSNELWQKLTDIKNGKKDIDSIKTCYYRI